MRDSSAAIKEVRSSDIAIIAMNCRFPGARNVNQFWENLKNGVESIVSFTEDELRAAGVPDAEFNDPHYVKSGATLDDIELFDPAFFGFTPREAQSLDPQHRLFLESAWELLESAGYDVQSYNGSVGIYAGIATNNYLSAVLSHGDLVDSLGRFAIRLSNDKDFLATNISYRLNLRGPSLTVQTACSTSLVAVHLACQSLFAGECDMAVAGGVSIEVPQKKGYLYSEGDILSPDGHCRAFDARAQGTINGSGVGTVLLKRLEDALGDRDHIHAVIRGTAINNDGSSKVGYTAPSVEGQIRVIRAAQTLAEVPAETISYVEAHGTGTSLGDPIEVAALTEAFRASTSKKSFCAIGSVKTNVGHLNTAAGVAGFIKTVLALRHKQIPASLNFETPNPAIDFENSPIYVNTKLRPWSVPSPLRAGISSFGMGGTNAHVILQEAPERQPSGKSRLCQLLLLSARTENALAQASRNLAHHLKEDESASLADVAYTLQIGRKKFAHRQEFVCSNRNEAIEALEGLHADRVRKDVAPEAVRGVVFLFPGQGAQYVNMARQLYETEPVFSKVVDECCQQLKSLLRLDLRQVLFPEPNCADLSRGRLTQTAITQPALFVIEYALARLWMSWGVRPQVMIGHSIGEYVAACIAGTMSEEDALTLVCVRGQLMQEMPSGTMLAVQMSEEAAQRWLTRDVCIAAINSPRQCVLSGPSTAIDLLRRRLEEEDIHCRQLQTSHGFHSQMMDPILERFARAVDEVKLRAPRIPWVSNLTGKLVTSDQAMDPRYWVRHLREPVRFATGIQEILQAPEEHIFLEVGPGQTLSALVRHNLSRPAGAIVISSLPRANQELQEPPFLLDALGKLWLAGAEVNWQEFIAGEERHRVPLPTYPFERQSYMATATANETAVVRDSSTKKQNIRSDSSKLALPETGYLRPALGTPYVPPGNEVEAQICSLWQGLLGIAQIGIHDSFFEIGGNSLMATQLLSRMRKSFQSEIPLRAIFESSTIAQLARVVVAHTVAAKVQPGPAGHMVESGMKSAAEAAPAPPEINREEAHLALLALPRPKHLLLSYAQQRLWFIDQLQGASAEYNLSDAVRQRGVLDRAALERAINTIVARHEVLRTHFIEVEGEPFQVIEPELQVHVSFEDLSGLDETAQQERVAAAQVYESEQPFDLASGPLFRLKLLKLDDRQHVLLRTFHHIVFDGWSLGIFTRELNVLYEAFHDGRENPFPPLPIQYADFVLWQRRCLDEEVLAGHFQYWKSQLSGIPEQLALPLDHPRPEMQTFAADRCRIQLSASHLMELKLLSRSSQATLYMTLLAALAVLLQRYCGQNDIVIGSPVANRPEPQLEQLIGLFLNSLAMRVRVNCEQSFHQLLLAVRDTTLQAFEHQDLPFERLVEKLTSRRSLNTSPIFQLFFAVQNAPSAGQQFKNLEVELLSAKTDRIHSDIELHAWEADGRLELAWLYNRDIFDRWRIDQMAGHYLRLLQGLLAAPEIRIAALEMLDEIEKQQLLIESNRPESAYPQDKPAHRLMEEQVAATPGSVALILDQQRWTYKELNERANQLAHYLRDVGLGPESRVAILMERSFDMVVALFAVWKAGGAYVPLDPAYPAERLDYMLEDAQVGVLLTHRNLHQAVSTYSGDVIKLDEEWKTIQEEKNENLASSSTSGNLAYVIYTSGSTGKPKGTMVTHEALVNFLVSVSREPGIKADDVVLAVTTLSFDIAALEIYLPLITGASLVLATRQEAMDGVLLARKLTEHGVTMMQATPATWRLLLGAGWQGSKTLKVLCGGEALTADLAAQLREKCGALWNMYGPTETTVWSSAHSVTETTGSVPLGRPLANTQMYVLDQQMNPVPRGVAGELYIGGQGVARGYLNRPDLTAERFIPDPFAKTAGARLYYTGDVVRYGKDGAMEFLGRSDYQVKIRGFRIELGEIESALRHCEAVQDALVMVREDASGEKQLVAYVVPAAGEIADTDVLRDAMGKSLPAYMVPSVVMVVPSWPLTPSGKINRHALPAPQPKMQRYRDPRRPQERLLCHIFAEVLSLERVGVDDNFFSLGGHSLTVTRVVSRIRRALGTKLSVRAIFDAPTVAQLSQYLDNNRNASVHVVEYANPAGIRRAKDVTQNA